MEEIKTVRDLIQVLLRCDIDKLVCVNSVTGIVNSVTEEEDFVNID